MPGIRKKFPGLDPGKSLLFPECGSLATEKCRVEWLASGQPPCGRDFTSSWVPAGWLTNVVIRSPRRPSQEPAAEFRGRALLRS
jgi:hypothetical protein